MVNPVSLQQAVLVHVRQRLAPKPSPGRVSISRIPVGTFSFPGKRTEAALKGAMMRSGVHPVVSRLTRPFQAHDLSCSLLITLQQKMFSEGETEAWTGSMAYPRSGSQCPCVKDCIGQNCPTPSLSCLGGGGVVGSWGQG